MKRSFLISIPFLAVIALVIHTMGRFDEFTVWNCLPVVVAWIVMLAGLRRSRPILAAAIAYAVVSTGFTTFFQLAWLFDWDGTATGSSTSGIAFIFIPFWSVVFGSAAAYVVWVSASAIDRRKAQKREP